MLPMVAGAADDAGEVRREAVAAALAMNARLSAMEPSHDSSVPYWAERKATANIEEIRQYFADHPSPGRAGTGDGAGSGPLLELSDEGVAQLEEWHRRAHAVAVMANSISEVAVTLVSAQSLRTCLLAIEVASVCLEALHDSNAALQVGEEMVEASGGRDERERLKAPKQESPALLPAVHALWPALMGALRKGRLAVVEAALALLSKVAVVSGGQFIARRFSTDAWPLLQQMLETGESAGQRSSREMAWQGGHGASDASAGEQPAAVSARLRCAVLSGLERMSGCREGRAALRLCALPACREIARWLRGDDKPEHQAVTAAALLALEGLAALDADTVWLMVVELLSVHSSCKPATAVLDRLPPQSMALAPLSNLLDAPRPATTTHPSFGKHPTAAEGGEHVRMQLLALLDRINGVTPEWHERVMLAV